MNGSGVCWRLPLKRHCKCPFVRPWVRHPAPILLLFLFLMIKKKNIENKE